MWKLKGVKTLIENATRLVAIRRWAGEGRGNWMKLMKGNKHAAARCGHNAQHGGDS